MDTGFSLRLLLIAVLVGFPGVLFAQDYYLSSGGDDGNSGQRRDDAWRTLAQAGQQVFADGDRLLLRGGETFTGNLVIRKEATDSALTVTSYGKGRAEILVATGRAGILIHNTGNITLTHLALRQEGAEAGVCGILASCDDTHGARFKSLFFADLELSGFSLFGLAVAAGHVSLSGFDDVIITTVVAHHNQMAGISSWGYAGFEAKGWSHRNLVVRGCTVHDNYGIPEKRDSHSGSGIVMGGAAGILIEDCKAYANGKNCFCPTMGPVGIWVWDAKDAVIRRCLSHHNRTGAGKDGGGFDIDGGVVNGIMEDNVSHDNDGVGFLVCQYKYARIPLEDCIVRNNTSRNDGAVSGKAGIIVTGFDLDKPVMRITIENNLVETTQPAGIRIGTEGSTPCNVSVRDNRVFCSAKSTTIVIDDASSAVLEGNVTATVPPPAP